VRGVRPGGQEWTGMDTTGLEWTGQWSLIVRCRLPVLHSCRRFADFRRSLPANRETSVHDWTNPKKLIKFYKLRNSII